MSHDPALASDDEAHSGSWSDAAGMEATLAALVDRVREAHPRCRLLLGRYSAPLVEIGCPAQDPCCTNYHRTIEWLDRDWARILIDAGDQVGGWTQPMIRCWSRELLLPLAGELGAMIKSGVSE